MRINLSNRAIILISGCLVIPILAMVGCITGYSLYVRDFEPEPNETWEDLATPPAEIRRLLAADTATIYVQTNDDKIFSCYHASQYDQNCWNEVESIPEDGLESGPCPFPPQMPPIHREVTESLVKYYCIDSPVYSGKHVYAYILLADGTVMQWISSPIGFFRLSPTQSRQFKQKVFGGCFIGVISGIIVSLFLFRLRSKVINELE